MRCLWWILGCVALCWTASNDEAAGGEPPSPWKLEHTVTVDSEAWRWNWASWDQEKIATFGDYQYTVYSWVMNAGCMALDSANRPHVVTYKLPAPRRPEKLEHNPPPDIDRHLRVVHYWRADDGSWLGGEPIEAGSESGRVARGDIIFDGNDTLYFFYQPKSASGGFVCLEARAATLNQLVAASPPTSSTRGVEVS